MKREYKIIISALVVLMLSGCAEYNPFDGNSLLSTKGYGLSVSTTNLQFEAKGENSVAQLNVSSYTTPWEFTGMDGWLNVSPQSGNNSQTVTFRAAENTSGEEMRTTVFKLVSTDGAYPCERKMSATQACTEPMIRVAEDDVDFFASHDIKTVAVDANIAFTVRSSESWLSATISDDHKTLSLEVTENPTGYTRYASVYLEGKVNRTISVTQKKASFDDNTTDTIKVPVQGEIYDLNITSEVSWSAKAIGSAWISIEPDNGPAGVSKVRVTVEENTTTKDRNGSVQILTDNTYKALVIPVHQEGLYVRATEKSIDFGISADTKYLNVESNTEWNVISKPEWLTVSPMKGNGNTQLKLSVDDNWTLSPLEGPLVLGRESVTGLRTSIPVTQASRYFNNPDGSLTFDVEGTQQKLTIDTDGRWNAVPDKEWIHINPDHATGKAEMNVWADANLGEDTRRGNIRIIVDGMEKIIEIVQSGRVFIVEGNHAQIPSTGGRHEVHIKSNDSWTVASSASWMHPSSTSGTGDIDVTLTADDNPSPENRTDTTTFKATYVAQSYLFITKQDGRHLTLSSEDIVFLKVGGAHNITVDTDGIYDANKTAGDWFTLTKNGNVLTITAERNETGEERAGTIKVWLTDLKSGKLEREIKVVQRDRSGVAIHPFDDEERWELGSDGTITITVTGFGSDKTWDSTTDSDGNIDTEDFGEDKNWDY